MQNLPESDWGLYDLFDNLAILIRAEERKKCVEVGLQPTHIQMLNYLFRATDENNTPRAIAAYLGITPGPTSQSLILLEKKGLIERFADWRDRRIVHLRLSSTGLYILHYVRPVHLLDRINELWEESAMESTELRDFFQKALLELQK